MKEGIGCLGTKGDVGLYRSYLKENEMYEGTCIGKRVM